MILRTIRCDVCNAEYIEREQNAGFPGWGDLRGISLDGVDNPSLCPQCLRRVADFVDDMKKVAE